MGKIALMALLVLAVIFLLRGSAAKRKTSFGGRGHQVNKEDSLVRCANCGIYLPTVAAVKGVSGKFYCEAAHRKNSGDWSL